MLNNYGICECHCGREIRRTGWETGRPYWSHVDASGAYFRGVHCDDSCATVAFPKIPNN